MLYFNFKMKLVFIMYQAIIHTCRSHSGYHHRYNEYESRHIQRNLNSRYATENRDPPRPYDITRSSSATNGSYTDQNVVVVPYPVPVLIFPINKSKVENNTTTTETPAKTQNSNQDTSENSEKNDQKVVEEAGTVDEESNDTNDDLNGDSNATTARSQEFESQNDIENTSLNPTETNVKIEEETQKSNDLLENTIERTWVSTEKYMTSQKPKDIFERTIKRTWMSTEKYITSQKYNYIARDLHKIPHFFNTEINNPTTFQQNYMYQHNGRPLYTESNIKLAQPKASPRYESLYSNSKYSMYHRDKGPPHLGPKRLNGPIRPRGIRLRPTIPRNARARLKTTPKTERTLMQRRKFKVPKFGLVQIHNDLANKLEPQMSRNIVNLR